MSNSSRGMGDDVVSFDDVIDRVIPAVAGRDDLVDVRTMTVYKPDGVVTDHVSVLVRDTTKRCALGRPSPSNAPRVRTSLGRRLPKHVPPTAAPLSLQHS